MANTISIIGSTASIAEGDPGGETTLSFTIARTGDLTESVTFSFAVTPGTGDDPVDANDFEGGVLPTGQFTLDAEQSLAVFDIPISEDDQVENDETLVLTISDPISAAPEPFIIDIASAAPVILNDDFAPNAVDDPFATDEDTAVGGNVLADNDLGPDTDLNGDALTVVSVNGAPLTSATIVIYQASAGQTPDEIDNAFEEMLVGAAQSPTLSPSGLTFSTLSEADNAFYLQDDVVVDFDGAHFIQFELQVDSSTETQIDRAAAGVSFTTENGVGQSLYIDEDRIFFTSDAGDGVGSFTTAIDTSVSHDYRIGITDTGAGSQVSLFVDEVLVLTDTLFLNSGAHGATERIAFGDISSAASGDSVWSSFTHDAAIPFFDLDTGADLRIRSDGTFSYDPVGVFDSLPAGNSDTDGFSYTITDQVNGQSTATVTIQIDGLNDAPLAESATFTIDEDQPLFGILIVSDPDDRDGVSVSLAPGGEPANGFANIGAKAGFSYIPNPDFNGTDSFTYAVSDGDETTTATITVTVNPVSEVELSGDFLIAVEADGRVALTATDLLAAETGSAPGDIVFTVGAILGGVLEFATAPGASITSFTQADIDARDVRFVSDGATGPKSFEVSAADVDGEAATATITVIPADAPRAVVDLASLDGSDGFALQGIDGADSIGGYAGVVAANNSYYGDLSGFSVSGAGDFNGDGIQDVIIGAPGAEINGDTYTGESYVVFGSLDGFGPTFELSTLDGLNGVTIIGEDERSYTGRSVSSAGDLNGDGIDDIIIGSPYAGQFVSGGSGEAYVIFGSATLPSVIDVDETNNSLTGENGFVIHGAVSGQHLGFSIADAGDVNGDGIDDVIVGSPEAGEYDYYGPAGAAYVVFGSTDPFAPALNVANLDGDNGFSISNSGSAPGLGGAVSGAGDVNGDGFADLIVSASGANGEGGFQSARIYIVYGDDSGFSDIDVASLEGNAGTVLSGFDTTRTPSVTNIGDFNGDGVDDLAIGDRDANNRAGAVYILPGVAGGFGDPINLSQPDPSLGVIRFNGDKSYDMAGRSISGVGDVNGDGFDDLIIGAHQPYAGAGRGYLVFGTDAALPSTRELSQLNGLDGFRLDGVTAYDHSGFSVSGAGDVNGDGAPDLFIGAPRADFNGYNNQGASYVVFGQGVSTPPDLGGDLAIAVDFEASTVLTEDDLLDPEIEISTTGFVYHVTGLLNGDIVVGNDAPAFVNRFTQAELDAGAVRFLQNGALSLTGGFDVTVTDLDGQVSQTAAVIADVFVPLIAADDDLSTTEDDQLGADLFAANGDGPDFNPNGELEITRVNGDAASVGVEITLASGATLLVRSTGEMLYNPLGAFDFLPAGGVAEDSFTYTIFDGEEQTDQAVVTIAIDGVNDAPVAQDDAFLTDEDTAFSGDLLAANGLEADFDVDGGSLSVILIDGAEVSDGDEITLASGALLTINEDGTFDYDPNGAFESLPAEGGTSDGFTYTIFDGAGGVDTATATITIDGVNDAPVAFDDDFQTDEDTAIIGGDLLAANGLEADFDVDGDPLSIILIDGAEFSDGDAITLASGALLTIREVGTFDYDPNGAFESLPAEGGTTDGFTYTIFDGEDQTDQAVVTIAIDGVNDAPVAQDDTFLTDEDTAIIGGDLFADNEFGEDSDVEGDTLTIAAVNGAAVADGEVLTLASGALLTINEDGTFDYDPNGAFESLPTGRAAIDSFTYTVTDGGFTEVANLFGASLDLSSLDGTNGFVLNGIDPRDHSGVSVSSAGDINGDGVDDLIIGADQAAPAGIVNAGESYVVFGDSAGFAASLDLSSLNGANGFVLNGIAEGDFSGKSVSAAGDVNGDGVDDLIIGAQDADVDGAGNAGESYVVFGSRAGFAASFDLSSLNGSNGFVLNGIDASDFSGFSVSSAGDVNDDGVDDLIVGAQAADPNGASQAGESYVVFGSSTGFATSLDLSTLNGSNGFVVNGVDEGDRSGVSVSSAGDVNGDDVDDLIIGALTAAPNGETSGESYVVFGSSAGFAASFDLSTLNGSNGFVLNGIDPGDFSGASVSSAGDVNGDGVDDVIIGSSNADVDSGPDGGESYVVFGSRSGFAPSLDLSALNGENGFVLSGVDAGDRSGYSVSSAGDVNGDGIDDLIVGAFQADPGDAFVAGQSYVVFGHRDGFAASLDLSTLDGDNGFALNGVDAGDRSGYSVSAAGDVNGDGVDDLIIGALTASPSGAYSAGESYVIFGRAKFEPVIDTATATITINGVNDAPDAVDDRFFTDEDTATTGVVFADNGLGPDSDPESRPPLFPIPPQIGGGQVTTQNTSGTEFGFGREPTGVTDGANISVSVGTGVGTNFSFLSVTAVNGLAENVGQEITLASGAALHMLATGAFAYDPTGAFDQLAEGEVGEDSFTYTIADPSGAADTATATIEITGVNDAPVAVNDAFEVDEDTAIQGGDLFADNGAGPDSDVDNPDGFAVIGVDGSTSAVGQPITLASGARLTVGSDGVFNYDPTGAFDALTADDLATDGFTYLISDGAGGVDTATATIEITGVNDAPVGVNDRFRTGEDAPLAGDVLAANGAGADFDPDRDDEVAGVVAVNGVAADIGRAITLSSGASLRLEADGRFAYDPRGAFDALAAGEAGADSFTYAIADASGAIDTATATIEIAGVNDAPDAVDDFIAALEDQVRSFSPLAANNGAADSDAEGQSLTITMIDDTALAVGETVTLASGAIVRLTAAGTLDYDPNDAFGAALRGGAAVSDDFTYAVTDTQGGSDRATVTVEILDANDAPVPAPDRAATDEDTPILITVLGNDDDPEGMALSIVAINGDPVSAGGTATLASGARVTLGPEGALGYDPTGAFEALAAGEAASDRFIYTVADVFGETATASVTLRIDGANDAPVARDDFISTGEDDTVAGSLIGAASGGPDSDVDGDSLTVVAVNGEVDAVGTSLTLASGARLAVSAAGAFIYDPTGAFDRLNEGETGSDRFTYAISDGNGGTSTATATIRIDGALDLVIGSSGDDVLIGTEIAEEIRGLGGADFISGLNDEDTLSGGPDPDVVRGGRSGDVITGGGGNDRLFGEGGNDLLFGGDGDDLVLGMRGNDRAFGGLGDDNIGGGRGDDTLVGGGGSDRLRGGGGEDSLSGNGGADRLQGGADADRLVGGDGRDTVAGGGGDDTVLGGAGADRVAGRRGDDLLTGGAGADRFLFNAGDGDDTVTDFTQGEDLIRIGRGAAGLDDLVLSAADGAAIVAFANVTIRVEGLDPDDLIAGDFLF